MVRYGEVEMCGKVEVGEVKICSKVGRGDRPLWGGRGG